MNYDELEAELNRFSKYVIQQSRKNLTQDDKKGALYDSLSADIIIEGDAILVEFLMEDYGPFVDEGVKGANPSLVDSSITGRVGVQKAPLSKFKYKSKMPPLDMLINWAKSKNVRFRVKKGQKGAGQFKKGSYRSMGFWLQKSIYAQGLKGNKFFTKPFESGLKRLGDDIINAYALDVENNIILGIKK
jgi:hypothetical protein